MIRALSSIARRVAERAGYVPAYELRRAWAKYHEIEASSSNRALRTAVQTAERRELEAATENDELRASVRVLVADWDCYDDDCASCRRLRARLGEIADETELSPVEAELREERDVARNELERTREVLANTHQAHSQALADVERLTRERDEHRRWYAAVAHVLGLELTPEGHASVPAPPSVVLGRIEALAKERDAERQRADNLAANLEIEIGAREQAEAEAEKWLDRAAEIQRERDEAMAVLREIVEQMPHNTRSSRGQAPGHAHSIDGQWDGSGTPCTWCATWDRARALLGTGGGS